MMALFLTLSLNAQNKTEYMSYFASDSTTANVCINGIDNIHTCIFNFHKDNIMTINGKEYYVATVYQWKFGYETTSASYYNNEYNILLREETETGRLYRYDMEGEKEILVCDMSLEIGDVIQFYLDNKDIQDITVDKISYTESGKKKSVLSLLTELYATLYLLKAASRMRILSDFRKNIPCILPSKH